MAQYAVCRAPDRRLSMGAPGLSTSTTPASRSRPTTCRAVGSRRASAAGAASSPPLRTWCQTRCSSAGAAYMVNHVQQQCMREPPCSHLNAPMHMGSSGRENVHLQADTALGRVRVCCRPAGVCFRHVAGRLHRAARIAIISGCCLAEANSRLTSQYGSQSANNALLCVSTGKPLQRRGSDMPHDLPRACPAGWTQPPPAVSGSND